MKAHSTEPIRFHESLPLALMLFIFWVILSGKTDLVHLGAGALTALTTAYGTCRLYALPPSIVPEGKHPFRVMPWLRFLAYVPWLGWQIVVASVQVARVVLRPTLEIEPRLIRFRHELPHNLARTVLAHSITLTPGTVTLDVRGDEYLVHALTENAAAPLLGNKPNDMKQRISDVFPSHRKPQL